MAKKKKVDKRRLPKVNKELRASLKKFEHLPHAPNIKKKKSKAGRPKFGLNAASVEKLAKINCSLEEMAAVLDCSVDTLGRNFAEVIEKGRQKGTMSLKRKQAQVALDGSVPMLIWLGKQRLGQRDKQESFHNWANPFEKMSDEDLARESNLLKEIESNQQKVIAPTPQPENQNEVIDLESTDAGRNYKPKLA